MTHEVEYDPAELAARFTARERLAAELEPYVPPENADTGDPAAAIDPEARQAWWAFIDGMLPPLESAAPNWEQHDEGRAMFIDGAADQLTRWFPNGPPKILRATDTDNMPPWGRMLLGLLLQVWRNFDVWNMRLKPLALPPPPDEDGDTGSRTGGPGEGAGTDEPYTVGGESDDTDH
jgi:hypothetical protein